MCRNKKTAHHPEHSGLQDKRIIINQSWTRSDTTNKSTQQKIRFKAARDFRQGQGLQKDNILKHVAKATMGSIYSKHIYVLEWPSQIPDLIPADSKGQK